MICNNEKVFVGVDPHKDSIACFVNGKFKQFKTNPQGFAKALQWVRNIEPDSAWAIEGAYHYGLTFSTFLLESGCKVYEFNALATSKARKALSVAGNKNDYGDAKVISIFAKQMNLQEVSLKTIELKRIISRRRLLVKQRTELINNLKSTFVQLGIKTSFNSFSTQKASKWLSNHESSDIQIIGKVISELNNAIKKLEEKIEELTPKKAKN